MQVMPSYEVNIEICQSEGFSQWKNNLTKVEHLMLTSYEVNNGFIIQKLHKDVYNLNFLLCRSQQNNFQF